MLTELVLNVGVLQLTVGVTTDEGKETTDP